MIKRTFYNLPPEKREKIIDVTRKEFRKGSKKKITINSVIKNAGISRGSFYQYFDDKLDLVELMADDMMNKMSEYIKEQLILYNGDIFEIPLVIFDVMFKEDSSYKDIVVFTDRNNQNSELISEYMFYRFRKYNFWNKLSGYINRSKLRLNSDEDIKYIVFIMEDAFRNALSNISKNPKLKDRERTNLANKVDLLKRAVSV
ncbi:MAG: TetR/AcrR family transcriptional regulator [Ruminococcus sp.]|nr:TetR/AcrR family transcriptional regulator [Ruminococcus sp.]